MEIEHLITSSPEMAEAAASPIPAPSLEVRKIKVGDNIILCLNEDKYIFAEVQPTGTVNVNKRRYPLSTLIGAEYRSVWEAPRTTKYLIQLKEKPKIQDIADLDPTVDADIKADNRDLVDNNKSQKLTQQEILEMQDKGASGETIIKALVQNSVSYQGKTEFSKAKYLKKKAKKHIMVLEVIEPSLVNIATAYFSRKPASLCNMRVDSLARLLTFSDARPGSNVLVLENCKGVVTGALAERVGGHGKVVSLHMQNRSNTSAIDLFNFSDEVKKSILHTPLSSVRELYRAVGQQTSKSSPDSSSPSSSSCPSSSSSCASAPPAHRDAFSPMEQVHEVFAQGFDSLVIAVKAVPAPFLFGLLPFLKPSSPFVVFSPFIQQLMECYVELMKAEEAINLQVAETWMRQYQVLPSRTRPPMNMNGASGFLLTGVKIHNEGLTDSAGAEMDEADAVPYDGEESGSGVTASKTVSPKKKKARTEQFS